MPITYGLDLLLYHLDALMGDDVAQESHLILVEATLLEVGVQ